MYGEIPCPDEWLLISDTAYDRFAGMVDAEEVYSAMRHLLLCANCNRLWIYWDGFSEPPVAYSRE
jgi:hypothetical protein